MILYKLADKKTCWWTNGKKRRRTDSLFTITRTWCRIERVYIWRLTIGRFSIGYIK